MHVVQAGLSRTKAKAKAKAACENGKKGGRPGNPISRIAAKRVKA